MTDLQIKLSRDEALVLFEFLYRFSQNNILSIQDQSEMRVLWDLTATLEKELSEPFQSNYSELVELARAALRDEQEASST